MINGRLKILFIFTVCRSINSYSRSQYRSEVSVLFHYLRFKKSSSFFFRKEGVTRASKKNLK